jgi:hypothetical protein
MGLAPTFFDGMARNERPLCVEQLRLLAAATVICDWTARMEATTRGRPDRVRYFARQSLTLTPNTIDTRDRIEE